MIYTNQYPHERTHVNVGDCSTQIIAYVVVQESSIIATKDYRDDNS